MTRIKDIARKRYIFLILMLAGSAACFTVNDTLLRSYSLHAGSSFIWIHSLALAGRYAGYLAGVAGIALLVLFAAEAALSVRNLIRGKRSDRTIISHASIAVLKIAGSVLVFYGGESVLNAGVHANGSFSDAAAFVLSNALGVFLMITGAAIAVMSSVYVIAAISGNVSAAPEERR